MDSRKESLVRRRAAAGERRFSRMFRWNATMNSRVLRSFTRQFVTTTRGQPAKKNTNRSIDEMPVHATRHLRVKVQEPWCGDGS